MNHFKIAFVVAAATLSTAALSQSTTPPPAVTTPSPAVNSMTNQTAAGQWRASKLVGLNVYDTQNATVGDIEEVLVFRCLVETARLLAVSSVLSRKFADKVARVSGG